MATAGRYEKKLLQVQESFNKNGAFLTDTVFTESDLFFIVKEEVFRK